MKKISVLHLVTGITIIPGPIVALIIPVQAAPILHQKLIDANMMIPKDVDPIATHPKSKISRTDADHITAKRLAALCLQSKSHNFQETALAGIPEALWKQVLDAYQTFTKDPEAKLGHRDQPYSLIIHMEEDQ